MDQSPIRQTRRDKKLTVREVAQLAHCSNQAVSQYETGRTPLISPTAQAILSALGLEVVIQPKKGRSKK